MALAAAQPQPALLACKKVMTDPGSYDGFPQKFHEWWSKIKVWIQVSMEGAMDVQVTAAVLSRLTGPKAGQWAQIHLDGCMVVAHALVIVPPLTPGEPSCPQLGLLVMTS